MKKILFALAWLIYLLPVSAQSVANNFGGVAFADAYDVTGTPFTEVNKKEVDGSPFLNDIWGSGSVVMKDGRNFKNIPLQFNLFTNQVYFKKDNVTYAFATPVSACTLSYTDESGLPKTIEIQSGFPEAGNKDASTFYMVLTGGEKFKLLKYSYKIIGKAYSYGSPERNVFQDRTEMYIYDVVADTRGIVFEAVRDDEEVRAPSRRRTVDGRHRIFRDDREDERLAGELSTSDHERSIARTRARAATS